MARRWISLKRGSEIRQMKMLEICLKLVGCKSKKGLSSASSYYFEGKNSHGTVVEQLAKD